MDTKLIQTQFTKLGARARIRPLVPHRWRPTPGPVVIDTENQSRAMASVAFLD